ncbi:FkbM family methyltransferase [bacterium]|nr:FkbM family methyltransferase [bacterium]
MDKFRFLLYGFSVLFPFPLRYLWRENKAFSRGLKLIRRDCNWVLYERKGVYYIVPDDGEYISYLFYLIRDINLLNKYQEPPVIVEEGDIVIDCGANIGVASLLFAKKAGKGGKVIAIEPEERNYEILERMANENEGRIAPILPLKVAVYKQDCSMQLLIKSSASHSLSPYKREEKLSKGIQEVTALKIDTIIEETGLERVDFIKMDIEGAEVDALLGAEKTISQFKPKLAICSYHRPTDPIEIREILLKYNPNYKFKEIERGEKVLFAWDDESR